MNTSFQSSLLDFSVSLCLRGFNSSAIIRNDAGNAQPKKRGVDRHGFSLTEALAAIVIVVILLSILIPYISYNWEVSNRLVCAGRLNQLRDAIQRYCADNQGNYPRVVYDTRNPDTYKAFTGADDENVFARDSRVSPNDVSASLWLLVRTGQIKDTVNFVCPSSSGYPDLMTDAKGATVDAQKRGNFRSNRNLTYSCFFPFSSVENYNNRDLQTNGFAILADQNPGGVVTITASSAIVDQAPINSRNHRGAGQNVVYSTGQAMWQITPYCGQNNDNIYSVRRTKSTTQPENLPANAPGVITHSAGPVATDDSYLVPTAEE